MPSNSDARKKAKELAQLKMFKELFGGFPIGDISESENPDFLVGVKEGCIGIEITELHQEASEGAKQSPRAQSATKEAVLRQAERLCEEWQLGSFHVNVNFHPGCEVSRARQQALAGELA